MQLWLSSLRYTVAPRTQVLQIYVLTCRERKKEISGAVYIPTMTANTVFGSTQLAGCEVHGPSYWEGGSHAVLCGSTQLAGCEVHGPSYWEGEVMQCCVAPLS